MRIWDKKRPEELLDDELFERKVNFSQMKRNLMEGMKDH
jgi:hypothetical protein